MIQRLESLNEDPGNLEAYKYMVSKLQEPFNKFNTEWKYVEYMKNIDGYIAPEEVTIDVKNKSSIGNTKTSIPKSISFQFVSLRWSLKIFLIYLEFSMKQ